MNKKVNKSRLMLKINAGLLKGLTDDELRLIKTPAFALLFDKKYPNAPLSIEACQKLGLIVNNRKLLSMMMAPSSLFMTYFNSLDKSVQHELCKKEIYKEHLINYATLMVNTSFEKDFINFVNQHQITIEIKCLFLYLYKQLKNKIPKSLKLVKNSELFLTRLSFKDINDIFENEDVALYQYLSSNKNFYCLTDDEALKVKKKFFDIYSNHPNMDLKNNFCQILISKFGLPIPKRVNIDFLNSTIICENKKYKEELLKKAKNNLSLEKRLEWFMTTRITNVKLIHALFDNEHAVVIVNAFKSAKMFSLSRKEALLGIKTISKNEVFNIQEINLS